MDEIGKKETELNYKEAYLFLFNRLTDLAEVAEKTLPPKRIVEIIQNIQMEAERIAIRE